MFLVASQVAQFVRPSWIDFPTERLWRGALIVDDIGRAPFVSRLKRCVTRFGGARIIEHGCLNFDHSGEVALLSFDGGFNENHVRRSPATEEGTRKRTEAVATHRRGTRGVGKCQPERHFTNDVCRCSPANQSGAESAMGEAEVSQAEANDLSGRQEADRGGAASKVGEGEAGSLKKSGAGKRASSAGGIF